MKNMLTRSSLALFLTCTLALVITGCAHDIVTLASGMGLSDAKLAILRRDPNDGDGIKIHSYLNGVVDFQGREIVLKSQGFGDYEEIKLAPGTYDVMMKT